MMVKTSTLKQNIQKNSAFIVALCLSTTSLISCSQLTNQSAENKPFASDKNVVVGISPYRDDDLFIKGMLDNYEKEAGKFSNVNLNVISARNKQAMQNKQIDSMIADNNNALLINMVDVSNATEVGSLLTEKAKKANVPIVFFNRDPGSKVLESYKNAYYVGSIPAQSGLLQGELIVKDWLANPKWDLNNDGKLQYVLLKGEIGHADAEGRTKWAQATIQNYPDKGIQAEKLAIIPANWQREEAKVKLNEWLNTNNRANEVEVIIANNDGMALGVLDLLKEKNMSLPVYGVDAVPEALDKIKSGEMAGTILQDTVGQVSESLKLSINLANARTPKYGLKNKIIDKRLMVPYVAINQSNVNDFS